MLMTVFFALTAGLGLVLSNTATAVLVTPIALRAAVVLDVSPYPLAMAVAIAASAAFITPVSTPVVTLVVAPGNYSFLDSKVARESGLVLHRECSPAKCSCLEGLLRLGRPHSYRPNNRQARRSRATPSW